MLHRIAFLIAAAAVVVCCTPNAQCAGERFNFAALKRQAESLSSAPHVPPSRVSEPFLKLDYDGYRLVAARHENALWRDASLPFWAEFFLAGFIYEYPVEIHTVDEEGNAQKLAVSNEWFQFRGAARSLETTPGGGFSGFRLLTQLGANPEKTEFLVFQGASYFRGRGSEQVYGASARGLAIDIGLPSPEEFPRFRKCWIERPKKDAQHIRVWALMDSPAASGASEFVITPGKTLAIDVETEVWFRHGVQKVAIAPLTSMWMWDGSNAPAGDPRPEVHDSDGLLIQAASGERTWRPLNRPKSPQVSRWPVTRLAGFGLLQRDRAVAHYRDAEAKYHERPSLWVTPVGDWGPGHVELLELPAETEGMDNIGAYWVSDKAVAAGSHLALRYRLTFGDGPEAQQADWQVIDSRIQSANEVKTFEIEFSSTDPPATAVLPKPKVTSDNGAIEGIQLLPQSDGHLLVRFAFRPANANTAHIQAKLRTDSGAVSENWSYQWKRN